MQTPKSLMPSLSAFEHLGVAVVLKYPRTSLEKYRRTLFQMLFSLRAVFLRWLRIRGLPFFSQTWVFLFNRKVKVDSLIISRPMLVLEPPLKLTSLLLGVWLPCFEGWKEGSLLLDSVRKLSDLWGEWKTIFLWQLSTTQLIVTTNNLL